MLQIIVALVATVIALVIFMLSIERPSAHASPAAIFRHLSYGVFVLGLAALISWQTVVLTLVAAVFGLGLLTILDLPIVINSRYAACRQANRKDGQQ